ncbi:MAG: hypothetical protein H6598_03255 [Flavobacteriales bacterium]|nr:hypothetical protein [Flavobacteriales bacterium]
MKKIIIPLISFGLFIVGCGTEENSESNQPDKETKDSVDEVSGRDTLEVELIDKSFNMFPDIYYEEFDDYTAPFYGDLILFEGTFNEHFYSLMIIPHDYYGDRCEALLYDNNEQKATYLTSQYYSGDSVDLLDKSTTTSLYHLSGKLNDSEMKLQLISNGDTVNSTFFQRTTTPVERQLFVELIGSEFANTPDELVSVSHLKYQFCDFLAFYTEGTGYDFGQEWWTDHYALQTYDSSFIYIQCNTVNSEYTNFKEGHAPSGIDDEDYIVEGMGYSGDLHCLYQYLENNELKDGEFMKSYEYNIETWVINDVIIVMKDTDENNGYPSFIEAFQWNPELNEFELL